nr:YVTN family beta-propeller repeat-containing protein [uncultured Mediterranea sp.]
MTGMAMTVFAGHNPLYPTGLVLDAQGKLVMSEKGSRRVAVYSADGQKLEKSFAMPEIPTGVAADGNRVYVTTFETKGLLHVLDWPAGKEIAVVETGSGACSPIVNKEAGRLYVCNQFQNTVSEVDMSTNKVLRTAPVLREPKSAVVSKDGKYLYVTNFLPAQRADLDYVAACVSVIDLESFTKVKDIKLANGSNALRGICITPDGKYVYVSHNLGRYTVPTSQLQQGWMNTSAFSVIDTEKQEFLGVVIVDEPERGAAGIWSIACNDESIFISHSGTHEISVIRHKEMLDKFLAYPDKKLLEYDLTFLYGLRERIPLQGNGPRAILLADRRLFVPTYFADILNVMDIHTLALTSANLNPERVESDIDKGEKYFNDASHCFQNWQSCNGCHPGDARTDGMNWDLMNDGVGNSKNCKSMLFSHVTPPSMISGVRESAEWAVRAGFKFIQFFDVSEEDARCVDAYLKSLQPVPSPYLVNGELSEKAQAGKKVFDKLKCGECHSGIYYTDLKMHRIGEDVEFEKGWDTPTLREVWRTAPYLFDGRAATMQEVFEVHRHGIEKKVSKKDIEALTEYVNSL